LSETIGVKKTGYRTDYLKSLCEKPGHAKSGRFRWESLAFSYLKYAESLDRGSIDKPKPNTASEAP
jgi:hypothetical protein